MSHAFASEDPTFKNVPVLIAAFKLLGWTVEENTNIRSFPGDPAMKQVFPFVARNPQLPYDVGITPGKVVKLTADFEYGKINTQLGAEFKILKSAYTEAALRQVTARQKGSIVTNKVANKTKVKLVLYV